MNFPNTSSSHLIIYQSATFLLISKVTTYFIYISNLEIYFFKILHHSTCVPEDLSNAYLNLPNNYTSNLSLLPNSFLIASFSNAFPCSLKTMFHNFYLYMRAGLTGELSRTIEDALTPSPTNSWQNTDWSIEK